MKRVVMAVVGLIAALGLMFGLASCGYSTDYEKRKEANKVDTTKGPSLERKNLERKIQLEENADRPGYVYLLSFGKPFGYYAIKGKVSASGSQLAPEDDIICRYSGDSCQAVDGPQDDGTYGEGDPGIFFFTADGVFVHTNLDYFYTTQPIPTAVEVPKLG